MRKINKKSQIWVETVIYTLIGLSILGLVLAFAKPKIDELKDKSVIEQSIDMLNSIDQTMSNIKYVSGNSRPIELKIQRGELLVDGVDNYIEYSIKDSKYRYSEPGQVISIGNINVLTLENAKTYSINLNINYTNSINLTWNREDVQKVLQPAPKPYNIVMANKGYTGGIPNIDFS